MNAHDEAHLVRCIELAATALDGGNPPFGAILVGPAGAVLFEDHNRTAGGDETRHPEFTIAEWAMAHLDAEARAAATVYTSNEHCPMCAGVHGWAGLGRIVYAASSAQLAAWLEEAGVAPPPVAFLPIRAVLPGAVVDGPSEALGPRVRALHRRYHGVRQTPLRRFRIDTKIDPKMLE